jgi:hypothetical protein
MRNGGAGALWAPAFAGEQQAAGYISFDIRLMSMFKI